MLSVVMLGVAHNTYTVKLTNIHTLGKVDKVTVGEMSDD